MINSSLIPVESGCLALRETPGRALLTHYNEYTFMVGISGPRGQDPDFELYTSTTGVYARTPAFLTMEVAFHQPLAIGVTTYSLLPESVIYSEIYPIGNLFPIFHREALNFDLQAVTGFCSSSVDTAIENQGSCLTLLRGLRGTVSAHTVEHPTPDSLTFNTARPDRVVRVRDMDPGVVRWQTVANSPVFGVGELVAAACQPNEAVVFWVGREPSEIPQARFNPLDEGLFVRTGARVGTKTQWRPSPVAP